MWKSLPSRHVLKTLRGSSKGKSPKRTISSSGGLEPLQMISKPDGRLSLEGDGYKTVCQQGCWTSKGGGLGVPHRLEKGTSVSEDARSEGGEL